MVENPPKNAMGHIFWFFVFKYPTPLFLPTLYRLTDSYAICFWNPFWLRRSLERLGIRLSEIEKSPGLPKICHVDFEFVHTSFVCELLTNYVYIESTEIHILWKRFHKIKSLSDQTTVVHEKDPLTVHPIKFNNNTYRKLHRAYPYTFTFYFLELINNNPYCHIHIQWQIKLRGVE